MISGSTTDETLRISQEIASRLRVQVVPENDPKLGQLTLVTSHPTVAVRLLDSMLQIASSEESSDIISFAVQPAAVARIRGGSVTSGKLFLVSACSGIIGFCGVFWTKRARASSLLYTSREVKETAGVPVIANLVDDATFPARARQIWRRRLTRFAVGAAEMTIGAVFLVMIFQLSTLDAFAMRFIQDPLAAYGEALTRLNV
jgi:hypothetical protein